jgi:hypothetical protein
MLNENEVGRGKQSSERKDIGRPVEKEKHGARSEAHAKVERGIRAKRGGL